MEKKQDIGTEVIERLTRDRRARIAATRENHLIFFATYFSRYMTFAPAAFHREMFALTERKDLRLLIIEAFRGSGKSTIMTTSFAIWGVLGKHRKKFVLILGKTERQAKQHFTNLKKELEGNDLLKTDLGPFETEQDEWGANSIVLTKYGARISFASIEQPVRGLRHGPYRPDLVIGDDLEDPDSARTKESRDKLHRWFTGEVLPIGAESTLFVLVGNLVHEDSLLSRLEAAIAAGQMRGAFRKYPLLDARGRCTWKERYASRKDVDVLRTGAGSEAAWCREYLLRIIADEERIIQPEWIRYYDQLPSFTGDAFWFAVTGIDLAISPKHRSDCTAMVTLAVFWHKGERQLYVLPNPVNRRMQFPETVEIAKQVCTSVVAPRKSILLVESVGYQAALWQDLKDKGYPAEAYLLHGQGKEVRLALISPHVKSGRVLFPKHGAKEIINQLVNFGVEKRDDLADAFSMAVSYAMEKQRKTASITYVGGININEPRYSMGDVFPNWR